MVKNSSRNLLVFSLILVINMVATASKNPFQRAPSFINDCFNPLANQIRAVPSIDDFSKIHLAFGKLTKETNRCTNPRVYANAKK